jgi:hypothetical protein
MEIEKRRREIREQRNGRIVTSSFIYIQRRDEDTRQKGKHTAEESRQKHAARADMSRHKQTRVDKSMH